MKSKVQIIFETRGYLSNHGAEPRGFGSWGFALTRDAIDDASIFWAHCSNYGAAKKAAAVHFKAKFQTTTVEHVYVWVLS